MHPHQCSDPFTALAARSLPPRPVTRSRRVLARHNRLHTSHILENDALRALNDLSRSFSTAPTNPFSLSGLASQLLPPSHGASGAVASKLRDNVRNACRRFATRRQCESPGALAARGEVPHGMSLARGSGSGVPSVPPPGRAPSRAASSPTLHDFNYSSARCLAVPLTAAKVSVPSVAGTASMLDFLPDDWRQRYADPSSSLRHRARWSLLHTP